MSLEELLAARAEANEVYVHPCIRGYMVDIIEATRNAEGIVLGVSPRGSLAFLRCVKAYAYLQGRNYVNPDDVKAVAVPCLAHRLIMGYGMDNTGSGAYTLMEKIVNNTTVPTEDFSA
jgi:MoxR-like ATPase